MKTLPTFFFILAAISAIAGMVWGIQMSATQNHALSPAHGHLNLIGFVVTSVYGTYYALVPSAAESTLAKAHLVIQLIAIVIIVPGIVMALTGTGELLAKVGSILTLVSMIIFLVTVIRNRQPG